MTSEATPTGAARVLVTTFAALVGFAANSLLCRLALASRAIDPASFTAVRLASGAIVLAAIAAASGGRGGGWHAGSWRGAAALVAYALAFSFAYVRLTTGTGALLLFGAVQTTMIGWSWRSGHRPRTAEWLGVGLALVGLGVLAAPGVSSPDPLAAVAMLAAGVAWGAYSLRGRRAGAPLPTTAGNFVRATPVALVALAVAAIAPALVGGALVATPSGVLLAGASGALASGLGYSLWYAVVPALGATRAAVVQLSVPVLAAAGGIVLLGEAASVRLLAAAGLILGGVGVVLWAARVRIAPKK